MGSVLAWALEVLEIDLPFTGTGFRIELGELESADQLIAGTSDPVELDLATDSRVGRLVLKLLQRPSPHRPHLRGAGVLRSAAV